MKVQEIVRSVPWMKWTPGRSKCYRDESFTRTKRKLRFKFDYIQTDLNINQATGVYDPEPFEKELRDLLKQHGHETSFVEVLDGYVAVYQEFPIQVTELTTC